MIWWIIFTTGFYCGTARLGKVIVRLGVCRTAYAVIKRPPPFDVQQVIESDSVKYWSDRIARIDELRHIVENEFKKYSDKRLDKINSKKPITVELVVGSEVYYPNKKLSSKRDGYSAKLAHRYLGPAIVIYVLTCIEFFRLRKMTSPTEKDVVKDFLDLVLDDSNDDDVVGETAASTVSSSSSSGILDEDLFENASDTDSVRIRRRLLMEQLRALETEKVSKQKGGKQKETTPSIDVAKKVKAKWNKKGELSFFSSDNEDEVKPSTSSQDEAIARQVEARKLRPPLKSSMKETTNEPPLKSSMKETVNEQTTKKASSMEIMDLINEIRNRPPPKIELGTTTTLVTAAQIHAENIKRNRIPKGKKEQRKLEGANRPLLTTDDPDAELAPSVTVGPAPFKLPSFREFMRELGLEKEIPDETAKKLYLVECRLLPEQALKEMLTKRAELWVSCKNGETRDVGTQTYVTHAGKPRVLGCVNCRSGTHHARDCQLPYRPGFCQICFADGYDTQDCVYPHGIEHEAALGVCAGCGRDLSLYCPECPDCNERYEGIVDWLRMNYATWPTWAVPADHRYLINEGVEVLKRKVKAKFTNPNDTPNRLRKFLIRENALSVAPAIAGRNIPTIKMLNEEKRQLALRALVQPQMKESLDEIIRKRPELDDGAEVKVILPTKYKQRSNK
ncbi:hypothetical protein PV327_010935 [Microctonus hyperodae]|uniref:Uncharacterized protein n=1 Tax=Microctonus hyperodae TaxID=165561 RepID=A0AA39EZD2_MICHY|nr:hypothetical protein PV327_010935 [Microctonus hyperodae]